MLPLSFCTTTTGLVPCCSEPYSPFTFAIYTYPLNGSVINITSFSFYVKEILQRKKPLQYLKKIILPIERHFTVVTQSDRAALPGSSSGAFSLPFQPLVRLSLSGQCAEYSLTDLSASSDKGSASAERYPHHSHSSCLNDFQGQSRFLQMGARCRRSWLYGNGYSPIGFRHIDRSLISSDTRSYEVMACGSRSLQVSPCTDSAAH